MTVDLVRNHVILHFVFPNKVDTEKWMRRLCCNIDDFVVRLLLKKPKYIFVEIRVQRSETCKVHFLEDTKSEVKCPSQNHLVNRVASISISNIMMWAHINAVLDSSSRTLIVTYLLLTEHQVDRQTAMQLQSRLCSIFASK